MRTMSEIDLDLQPLEDTISHELLPALTGQIEFGKEM